VRFRIGESAEVWRTGELRWVGNIKPSQEWEPLRRMCVSGFLSEDGLTTAEYAVGTVAVAGLGGVLIKLLTSEAVRDLIWTVVQGAFTAMLGS